MALENVAIIYLSNGPYHIARLNALSKIMPNLVEIEISSREAIRDWANKQKENFRKITLFNSDLEKLSSRELSSAINSALNKINPSIVIIAGYSNPAMRAAAVWARKRKAKSILMTESHYYDKSRNFLVEMMKSLWINHFYDAAFVGGTASKEYLVKLGFSESKIWYGYDSVDNSFFEKCSEKLRKKGKSLRKQLGLPEKYFIYVGRFSSEKNLGMLLNAYKIYKDISNNSWGLVLAGSGPEEKRLKALAKHLGLNEIVWPGFLQADELVKYYSCASALVLPSISEPWGLVVNEAMASGLPILISSKCGSARDLVIEGHNGFVFEPSSRKSIMDALMRISSQEMSKTKQMGKKSSDLIKKFNLKNHAESLINCINSLKT